MKRFQKSLNLWFPLSRIFHVKCKEANEPSSFYLAYKPCTINFVIFFELTVSKNAFFLDSKG